ncbi:VTC domain-containing protein [Fomitopsis serialis]|uniref:VTC domain-containing protein n=1 Tax=Fomitopsis serialis TaxID=139415 RepID=UPI0020085BC0|nr:VTC domain-containing protein [Neoantrodia serialis]KAH9928705.1 VTC domain-containing protein [Neoantrodia serialis]
MKFGRKISNDLYNEWRPFYINYNLLKRELKARRSLRHHSWTPERTTAHAWSDDDERDFTAMLEKELDKIHDFQRSKTSELARRIKDAERAVKRLVAGEHGNGHLQAGSSSDPEGGQREPILALEEEVATLVADVHDLALYTKLNITGFMKILKKQTNRPLKPTFIQDYLEKRPFYKYNWDGLIVKLSKLYDLVRTRGHPVQGDSSAGGNQSAFVRQTTKYWVHPDNLVHLKLAILRHLPVLVFNPDKEFEQKDAAITSVYFDNEDLELYLGRLEKTEGAEAIRLRWYGNTDVRTIFVERKTHREDWTGEKSVKARFPIKENLVNAFLRGEYTMDAEFQELVTKGKKTQQDVDGMIQLANEVQYAILTKKLEPGESFLPSLTSPACPCVTRGRLTMIREDNWDGRTRSGDNWRRADVGIDYPFDQLPPEDKELFKYGVLEVKLQTQYGQEPPTWVTDLVSSHLVEAVPKFSKFIHGCATLLPHRVDLVPFWLPQMDTDILKPDTGALTIERPVQSSSSKGTSELSAGRRSSGVTTPEDMRPVYAEPVSEGEEDEAMDLAPARDEVKRTGLSKQDVAAAIAFRESALKQGDPAKRKSLPPVAARDHIATAPQPDEHDHAEEADDEGDVDERTPFLRGRRASKTTLSERQGRALSIDPLAPSSAFDETLRDRLREERRQKRADEEVEVEDEDEEEEEEEAQEEERTGRSQSDDRVLERHWVAPPGKRIAVPVRIEPKKWLHFAIYIGTIATTAGLFTLAALVAIAYSAVIFVYRALKLRKRHADGLYYEIVLGTGDAASVRQPSS